MGDSLQDQLRALGLAKNKPDGRKGPGKQGPKAKGPAGGQARRKKAPGDEEMSLGKAYALREKEEKQRVEETRRRKREEDRRRREINNAIRVIVNKERLNDKDAALARNFMFRDRIRKLYVTPEQNRALARGEMGLVYLSGGYHVLPLPAWEQVREIDAGHLVDLGVDDDPDEEFPVPDDISW